MNQKVIKKHRKKNGITQTELAHMISVTQSTISMWENNNRRLVPEKAKVIAGILNFQWTEIYYEDYFDSEKV